MSYFSVFKLHCQEKNFRPDQIHICIYMHISIALENVSQLYCMWYTFLIHFHILIITHKICLQILRFKGQCQYILLLESSTVLLNLKSASCSFPHTGDLRHIEKVYSHVARLLPWPFPFHGSRLHNLFFWCSGFSCFFLVSYWKHNYTALSSQFPEGCFWIILTWSLYMPLMLQSFSKFDSGPNWISLELESFSSYHFV